MEDYTGGNEFADMYGHSKSWTIETIAYLAKNGIDKEKNYSLGYHQGAMTIYWGDTAACIWKIPEDLDRIVPELRKFFGVHEECARCGPTTHSRGEGDLDFHCSTCWKELEANVTRSSKSNIRLSKRVIELENAIREHRDAKADDRCWVDDIDLYKVLGDGIEPDICIGNPHEMFANCKRFIAMRCSGGKWKSYQELEKELENAKARLVLLDKAIGGAASFACTNCGHIM